jgi:ERCC4-type nuclease
MIVKIDNREQKPIEFRHPVVSEVVGATLSFGDYSATYTPPNVEPYESNLYFERKGLSDLFGTLTDPKRIQRFKEEVNRSKKAGADMIIAVEGTDAEVWDGINYGTTKGSKILRTLDTYWFKHHIPTIFCANRTMMAWRMVNLWETYYRYGKHQEHKQENKQQQEKK